MEYLARFFALEGGSGSLPRGASSAGQGRFLAGAKLYEAMRSPPAPTLPRILQYLGGPLALLVDTIYILCHIYIYYLFLLIND